MNSFTKSMFFTLVFVLMIPSTYSVFAQNSIENTTEQNNVMIQIDQLDNSLNPIISSTLTGLSLTGASFLVNVLRATNESKESNRINSAKKHFIKAFFMFIICTVLLFIFDFLQTVDKKDIVELTIIDVVTTYAFFGMGVIYLVIGARKLYFTFGK